MTQLGQMLVDWGIEQGLEQGIQKGAKQKTQEFIINALKLGLSDEDILRLTECTSDELQAAREHMALQMTKQPVSFKTGCSALCALYLILEFALALAIPLQPFLRSSISTVSPFMMARLQGSSTGSSANAIFLQALSISGRYSAGIPDNSVNITCNDITRFQFQIRLPLPCRRSRLRECVHGSPLLL